MSTLAALAKASTCFDLEIELVKALCGEFATPHSLAILIAIQNHEWDELKKLLPASDLYVDGLCPVYNSLGQPHGRSISEFKTDRLLSRLLSKSDSIPTGLETDVEALRQFLEIEDVNAKRVSEPPLRAPWLLELSFEVNFLLSEEGNYFMCHENCEQILSLGRLGPGGSAGLVTSVLSDKLRKPSSISPALYEYRDLIKGPNWSSDNEKCRITNHVEISTVPKTAWVDRTVSSVPVADMILQLGLGSLLEERLKRDRVNIRDQGRNQNLAKRAFELKLATIDLNSASSWFTEKNLIGILPDDLLHFVDLIRPHYWKDRLPGNEVEGEAPVRQLYNWLPMGCGYTFALMTLYFWALVRCTVPKSSLGLCSVYGDDIIVPQKYANLIVERLEYLGFKVNRDKSYLNGSFFESCGREYIYGHDVTPFYLRQGGIGSAQSTQVPIHYRVQVANKLRLWAKLPLNVGCDRTVKPYWDALIKHLPPDLKNPVPLHLGDVGLTCTLEESPYSRSQNCYRRGWEDIYEVKTWAIEPASRTHDDSFTFLTWLLQRPREDLGSKFFDFMKSYRDQTLYALKKEPNNITFSRGAEPLRNQFGKPLKKKALCLWPDEGLDWILLENN